MHSKIGLAAKTAQEHPMASRWTDEDLNAYIAKLRAPIAPRTSVAKPPPRPKYGNRKVTDAEGNVHDSTKEFRRWQELQLRERGGEITGLRRQVPFALVVNGVLVCRYIADAVYVEGAATVVEDTKSPATRKLEAYRIKVRLMAACHGLQVREV